MVHWVGEGSNVIICLARDTSPRNKGDVSPSTLFISYDYGKNFTNKTEMFRLGDAPDSGYAHLDKFFNHPKYPEFVSVYFSMFYFFVGLNFTCKLICNNFIGLLFLLLLA